MVEPQTERDLDGRRLRRQLLWWRVVTGLAIAALAVVAVRQVLPERTPGEGAAAPPAGRLPAPATIAPAKVEPGQKNPKWLDEQLLAHLGRWAKDHPHEYQAAIKMHEGAIVCMSDAALKSRARGEIDRLERLRKQGAKDALAQAKKGAGEFARDGDYDSAVALFDNVPEQFADLIGAAAKAAKVQFQAEAEHKIRAVLAVASRFSGSDKPEDGLAALDRMNIVYTPMQAEVQNVRRRLLVTKRALDEQRRRDALAAAKEAIGKLLDRVDATLAKGDVAGAANLVEPALRDETLEPAGELLKRTAAVCKLLPVVNDFSATTPRPTSADGAIAASMLMLASKNASAMATMLDAAKGHPLYDRYQRKMLWLRFRLGQAVGVGTRQRLIRIDGNDENLKDCVVKVQVPYDSDMRRDYADLRFLGTGGRALDYWIEKAGDESATVWVRVPSIPKGGTALALSYGNPKAKPASNGRKVFTFFDDFSDGLDKEAWEGARGSASVRDGVLTVSGGDNNNLGLASWKRPLPNRLVVEMRVRVARSGGVSRAHFAFYPEGTKPNLRALGLREGLAGIACDYDIANRGDLNPNPKSFHPIPVKKGVTVGPYWNKTWFRQTIAYDGTSQKNNLRLVCDNGAERNKLVHTGRPTDKRVRLYLHPWSWRRARIEIDWIAVRPFVAKEPTVSVGDEIVVASTAEPHPLREGLVAFWTADGDARDSVGTHHGTAVRAVTYTTDRHGKAKGAFLLDGKTGWIKIADDLSTLQLTGDLTYSAWVKTTAKQGGVILGRSSGSDATRIGSHMTMSSGGALAMGICGTRYVPGQSAASGGVRVNDGQWRHVAAVYVAGKSITVYVDGKHAGQNAAGIFPKLNPRKLPVCIGSRVSGFFFKGAIDDVGIWKRALTAKEIKLLHKTNAAGLGVLPKKPGARIPRDLPPGLVLYYPFDKRAAKALDKSGQGHHGAIRNAKFTPRGRSGGAMSFDGGGSIHCDNLTIGPANTWAFWMKLDEVKPGGDQYVCRAGRGPGHAEVHNYWVELLDHDRDGKLEMRTGGARVSIADGKYEFTEAGRWYHVAVTVDKDGALTTYVDGRADIAAKVPTAKVATVSIGDPGFRGSLDEIMIFRRALSAEEIARLHRAGAAGLGHKP